MIVIIFFLISFVFSVSEVIADDTNEISETGKYYDMPLEELVYVQTQSRAEVGSRTGSRCHLCAEVPIDVITSEQLEASGYTELSRVLSKLLPSFNYPRPSITDGTDHAPPFTLRGLNPDQVLVLINGKRLHQGSLLHINGTIGRGSSGVDLNTIPIRAIERIEVLRDGAAAQYGSDAIAGIINIILKGYGFNNSVNSIIGKTTSGDGLMKEADLFYSFPLKQDGFFNITLEARHRGETNRAGGDIQDNGRINTHFGDPDTKDILLAINTEIPKGDITYYIQGLLNRRSSKAGAFYRRKTDSRNIVEIYPDGFLPIIAPKILDYSFTAGLKGTTDDAIKWDISYTQGFNDYHFYVKNSLNRSLGITSPTSFDAGGTRVMQNMISLDVSKRLGEHYLSGGLEFRHENYKIYSGEQASYILGPYSDWYGGSQGFPGFSPENEVSSSRKNYAAYLDLKYALTKAITVDLATRAEHYSDFGSTLDGKLALRIKPTSTVLLRASMSSGFRAPSLTQSYFSYTQTIKDGNDIYTYGNYRVNHPAAQALGAKDLKAEKSRHYTAGIVYQPNKNLALTADFFITDIKDRIMPTTYISKWTLPLSPEAIKILEQYGIDGLVYFTNALKTSTKGIDLRLQYNVDLTSGRNIKFLGGYSRASTSIKGTTQNPHLLGISMTDLVLDEYTRVTLEDGQPKDSIKLWTKYESKKYDLVLNINRFGSFSSTYGKEKITFGAKWTVDAEFSYKITKNITLSIGGDNIFNVKPDEWGNTDDRLVGSNKIIKYSQYAPFGYNGAYYYLRLGIGF
ncbi:MAG: TonB-dependent receptor [Thermodesulfovibrionales bacterium]|nr:TonB-dependent receptor [Thermodesulfovibrionales bacterium]